MKRINELWREREKNGYNVSSNYSIQARNCIKWAPHELSQCSGSCSTIEGKKAHAHEIQPNLIRVLHSQWYSSMCECLCVYPCSFLLCKCMRAILACRIFEPRNCAVQRISSISFLFFFYSSFTLKSFWFYSKVQWNGYLKSSISFLSSCNVKMEINCQLRKVYQVLNYILHSWFEFCLPNAMENPFFFCFN